MHAFVSLSPFQLFPSQLFRLVLPATLLALVASASASAGVEVVDFEAVPTGNAHGMPLTEEYAELGVHFYSADDAVVDEGMSTGDPRGWQIEGTNGPRFLGFDGDSYSVVLTFDAPVQDFQLDLTRAAPHPFMAHQAIVVGLLGGEVVDEQVLYLGAVNSWATVALAGELDQVVVEAPGQPGSRFGVDNVQWLGPDREEPPVVEEPPGNEIPPVPDEIPVRIDVHKGHWLNLWKRGRRALARVVIFGADDFDVTEVDVDSLELEPIPVRMNRRRRAHFIDADRDGHLDVFLHLGLDRSLAGAETDEVCLMGETVSGQAFSGCDTIERRGRRNGWQRAAAHRARR